MAQLVVRNLEPSLKDRFQRRAKRNGRSMEEEVREILREAVNRSEKPAGGSGSPALFWPIMPALPPATSPTSVTSPPQS